LKNNNRPLASTGSAQVAVSINSQIANLDCYRKEKRKYSIEQICEERLGINANECPSSQSSSLKIIKTLKLERGPPSRVKPDLKKWERAK